MKSKLIFGVFLALVCSMVFAYADTAQLGLPLASQLDTQNIGLAALAFGTISVFDTTQLLEVLRVQKKPTTFWLDKCFPYQINFTEDKIAFDKVSEDYRRLAPFVAPNVQGKVMMREGSEMVAFKPAYVKPKHVIDPTEVIVRQPGEALGSGSLTPEQRREAIIANLLERHKNMHIMRREWMAARAVIDGKVVVKGENYPEVTVDFRRHSSLTIVLAGAAKWDAPSTATPLADIKGARQASNTLCGAVIRDLIFGAGAWAKFIVIPEVKALLDKQQRGSESDFTKMAEGLDDIEYLGTLQGSNGAGLIRMWLYSAKYMDESSTLQDMMDSNTVVGVDFAAVQGHRCFGAIMDKRSGYQPLDMFPKMWEDEDPSVEYLMTQSAPLMVPKQPNASFSIKVA